MSESAEARLKRLRIRSWRRGTKEMDLILGPYFDAHGAALDAPTLAAYESLLDEADQDLYQWVSGQAEPPSQRAPMIAVLQAFVEKSR